MWAYQGVEDVEDNDICHHDSQEDDHNLFEGEVTGCHNDMARHVHHSVDITAPKTTPQEAMIITVRYLATLAPTADCKKLTASLLTPTKRSNIARHSKKTTIHK
jgi:hypothetical protein